MPISEGTLSLLGYSIGADVRGTPFREQTLCEAATELRKCILCRIAETELNPDKAIQIDGETWDPVGLVRELRNLYAWTYEVCGMEEGPAAVSSVPGKGCGGAEYVEYWSR